MENLLEPRRKDSTRGRFSIIRKKKKQERNKSQSFFLQNQNLDLICTEMVSELPSDVQVEMALLNKFYKKKHS